MESIVAFIVILGAVLAYVGYPLFKKDNLQGAALVNVDPKTESLLSQKESSILAIKELDFDRQIGNLSEEDYRELVDKYRKRAITLIKDLDTVEKGDDLSQLIDRQVAELRHRRSPTDTEKGPACPKCGYLSHSAALFCSQCGCPLSLACPGCGVAYNTGDRFCSQCGKEFRG